MAPVLGEWERTPCVTTDSLALSLGPGVLSCRWTTPSSQDFMMGT